MRKTYSSQTFGDAGRLNAFRETCRATSQFGARNTHPDHAESCGGLKSVMQAWGGDYANINSLTSRLS